MNEVMLNENQCNQVEELFNTKPTEILEQLSKESDAEIISKSFDSIYNIVNIWHMSPIEERASTF